MGLFGRRGSNAPKLKILFVTDLHGSDLTFRKLLRVLELWSPDVLVVGGDVAGKGLLPVVSENGRSRLRWMGEELTVTADELPRYEDLAMQFGFYPYATDSAGITRLHEDGGHQEEVFEQLMLARWEDWLQRLEARCADLQLPAFVIAGNDDPWSLDEASFRSREWVTGADGKVLPLAEEWTLISLGLANETPWGCPRDTSEEEMAKALEGLAAEVEDFSRVVANIHVPPFDSSLDIAPRLDTSVDPPRPIAGATAPVGSKAVADFLRERQPALSLHGHIHESPGAVNIGSTRAINPGSEYAEGVLRGVLVTIEPSRVTGHQFVTG
jgi:Icc-related predicted phosphoesterase